MIGGKTPPAERNSQGTFPLKMYNLKTRRRCFYFPPHSPSACHSAKRSRCTAITECTMSLSKAVLAGKWETPVQKQMLSRAGTQVCEVLA